MTIFCRAALNYIRGARTIEVEIRDGRRASLPGWEVCGFELIDHPSAITDWSDDDALASVHYPEIEELARKMTNADVALVSSHIKRNPEQARTKHSQLSPITFVHSDFAASHVNIIRNSYKSPGPNGIAALARNGIASDAVETATRIVILQFWRNIGPPKMDYPLAWCDSRTVAFDDARAFRVDNYAGTGATFDALAVDPPATPGTHEWYAFPELLPDEAVAFRTYDTDLVRDHKTFFTPHSAFRDPDVELGQPARSSIEMRATCLFF